ncbi:MULTISPECIES: heavy-metal-associated domain-containing protein [Halorussus]|uniref:heavy-metal-associated domain-containing protein n=1 Tax=Halorussus TaxID=1070314 RepID=UPI0020A1AB5F|nr:heavy metal-associated domain-containing protein [Halorussus vallis]USZ74280.1 heavy-metal-associated domain-containing protein [Halorussus vallis]
MQRYELRVIGMSCNGCETVVEDEVTRLPGVASADADSDENVVVIEGKPDARDAARKAVTDVGYEVEE